MDYQNLSPIRAPSGVGTALTPPLFADAPIKTSLENADTSVVHQ